MDMRRAVAACCGMWKEYELKSFYIKLTPLQGMP